MERSEQWRLPHFSPLPRVSRRPPALKCEPFRRRRLNNGRASTRPNVHSTLRPACSYIECMHICIFLSALTAALQESRKRCSGSSLERLSTGRDICVIRDIRIVSLRQELRGQDPLLLVESGAAVRRKVTTSVAAAISTERSFVAENNEQWSFSIQSTSVEIAETKWTRHYKVK